MKEPQVTVGIMSERQIRFVFNGTYLAMAFQSQESMRLIRTGNRSSGTETAIPESFSLPKKKTIRFVSKR